MKFYIVLISILCFSCASKKEIQTNKMSDKIEEQRPYWIKSRPVDSQYYIGIGIASKLKNPIDFQNIAKKNALEDLTSEIKVTVKANSMLFTFESNGETGDEYKSVTQLISNEQIENFETVDSWENDEEYWIFYKLSKYQYKEDKIKKTNKAINRVKYLINEAESISSNKINLKLNKYYQALDILKPFLAEPLETTINNKKIFLGAYLRDKIEFLVEKIKIISQYKSIKVYEGKQYGNIFFKVENNQLPMPNIPIIIEYKSGIYSDKFYETSNQNGQVSYNIGKIKINGGETTQKIITKIDLYKLYKQLIGKSDETILKILNKINLSKYEILIHIEKPKVFINLSEKMFKKKYSSNLKEIIKSTLLKQGFEFTATKSNADIIFELNVNVLKKSNNYNLKSAEINGQIKVTDLKTKNILYIGNIEQIRGTHNEYKLAGEKAYETLKDEIKYSYIPQFKRAFFK